LRQKQPFTTSSAIDINGLARTDEASACAGQSAAGLNANKFHFAVGVVNVMTGNFLYFDNKKEVIEAEYVMTSGALPMVKIGTDRFRDGATA
jgi:hypothetical protein